MSEHILVEREGGLLTLRLNRADKKNALTRAMYSQMADVLDAANAERSVRVVLITGGPECFTSGNDVADFLQAPPTGLDSPVFQFMRALFDFEKPVVAAVAGPAVGIGTTLLLHCDLVYVSRDAKLRTPFVNLGLCPEFGSSLLLPQLLARPGPPKCCCSVRLSPARRRPNGASPVPPRRMARARWPRPARWLCVSSTWRPRPSPTASA